MIARTVHIMFSSPRDSFFRVCESNMLFRASDFDPATGRRDARERFAKTHFFCEELPFPNEKTLEQPPRYNIFRIQNAWL